MTEQKCKFCDENMENFLIKKFKFWKVYLAENQYYPGRIYVVLNRHGPEKTSELSEEEWVELKKISDKLTDGLSRLFNYDLIQYFVSQTRDRHHFHMHIIPRYESKRVFYGIEFKDEQWGNVPYPTPKREFEEGMLNKLKKEIQEVI